MCLTSVVEHMPTLHLAAIGIEKFIPRLEHLAGFVRLLSRSALGSPITQYTSHFRGVRVGGESRVSEAGVSRWPLRRFSYWPVGHGRYRGGSQHGAQGVL
jgi:hypothetical protein